MVICLERGADLHVAQLKPLPLTVTCFSKTQTGFNFLVPAYPGSPGQRAVKRVCVCVWVGVCVCVCNHKCPKQFGIRMHTNAHLPLYDPYTLQNFHPLKVQGLTQICPLQKRRDQFSCFCTVLHGLRNTDKHTERQTTSTTGHILRDVQQ